MMITANKKLFVSIFFLTLGLAYSCLKEHSTNDRPANEIMKTIFKIFDDGLDEMHDPQKCFSIPAVLDRVKRILQKFGIKFGSGNVSGTEAASSSIEKDPDSMTKITDALTDQLSRLQRKLESDNLTPNFVYSSMAIQTLVAHYAVFFVRGTGELLRSSDPSKLTLARDCAFVAGYFCVLVSNPDFSTVLSQKFLEQVQKSYERYEIDEQVKTAAERAAKDYLELTKTLYNVIENFSVDKSGEFIPKKVIEEISVLENPSCAYFGYLLFGNDKRKADDEKKWKWGQDLRLKISKKGATKTLTQVLSELQEIRVPPSGDRGGSLRTFDLLRLVGKIESDRITELRIATQVGGTIYPPYFASVGLSNSELYAPIDD